MKAKSESETPWIPLDFSRRHPSEMVARSRDLFADLNRRRTVREFSDEPVPIEVIENAVRCASSAPSGAHKQPWTFALVTNPETKRAIRLAAEEEERAFYGGRATKEWLEDLEPFQTDANKPFLEHAPALIVVFAQTQSASGDKHYYVKESVGIATGMLIASLHLCGLATLTHTPSPMKFLSSILDRPSNERAYLVIPVGYPAAGVSVPALERKTLDQVLVRFE